jgi:hypothetical protein
VYLKPSYLDHRSTKKLNGKFHPSETGIPIIGKFTITHARLLKELYDVYALMYDVVTHDSKARHFIKDKMRTMKFLCSKNKELYLSWYIRCMERSVNLELRLRRSSPTKLVGTQFCTDPAPRPMDEV